MAKNKSKKNEVVEAIENNNDTNNKELNNMFEVEDETEAEMTSSSNTNSVNTMFEDFVSDALESEGDVATTVLRGTVQRITFDPQYNILYLNISVDRNIETSKGEQSISYYADLSWQTAADVTDKTEAEDGFKSEQVEQLSRIVLTPNAETPEWMQDELEISVGDTVCAAGNPSVGKPYMTKAIKDFLQKHIPKKSINAVLKEAEAIVGKRNNKLFVERLAIT